MPLLRRAIPITVVLAGLVLAGMAVYRSRPVVSTVPAASQTEIPPLPALSLRPEPEQDATAPKFRDVAAEAGLTDPHFNAAEGQFRLVESMGSGVGLIDYDGDGWLDIFVAQGSPIPRQPEQQRHRARLYRNRRDGTFADVTESACVGFNGYGTGVAAGDYDGDGRADLYVASFDGGTLYHNEGDGTFKDTTAAAGLAARGWESSCAFADLDGDGDLDLYVVHYLSNTVNELGRPTVSCNALPGELGYCPPLAFSAEPDALYRNNGNGTFTDISRESGITSPAGNGLGLAILDWDDDGRLDIFVANDQTSNTLFRNLGELKFEDVAMSWGLAYNETGDLRAGMGVAAGDYDEDGRADLLVTNFYEEGSTLYRNAAPGRFVIETARARLTGPSRSKLGFGTGFLDFDNDGRLDLFVTNGHINDVRPLGIPYRMNPQLLRGVGQGRFADLSSRSGPYFQSEWLGRGAAFGDLDNDGDTDIVVTHLGRPPAVLINETSPRGHFLGLALKPRRGAGPCVGTRITAECGGRRLVRHLAGGTSYLGASDSRILIGLSEAGRVDRLEVRWPSGERQEWRDVEADRWLEAAAGRPELRPAAGSKPESHP